MRPVVLFSLLNALREAGPSRAQEAAEVLEQVRGGGGVSKRGRGGGRKHLVPLLTRLGSKHPASCTLHPAPSTLHPAPCTPRPAPRTLHPAPRALHPAPRTPHPAPRTLRPAPAPWSLVPDPRTQIPGPRASLVPAYTAHRMLITNGG